MKRTNNPMIRTRIGLFALFPLLLLTFNSSAASRKGPWTEEKANKWYYSQDWPVGCDYIVSNAINQIEMWQESTFSPELIDKELSAAEDLGFNTIRLFLHDLVYEADPKGFKARISQVLDICEGHGIRVVMTFFTNGGKFDNIALGEQPAPTPGIHNPQWRQSPGAEVVNDPSQWPRLEQYVKDILRRFGKDKRIYCWCLYNEPENDNRGANSLPLLKECFKWAWDVNPDQPLTAPFASLMANDDRVNPAVWGFLAENCDIISFHCYNPASVLMDKYITALQKLNRPIICTECVGRPVNTIYDMYTFCRKENVGVLSFGLFEGKTQLRFHWDSKEGAEEPKVWFHDLFREDGTPYDPKEVEFIKGITADKKMIRGRLPHTVTANLIDSNGNSRRLCFLPSQVKTDTLVFTIGKECMEGLNRIVLSTDFVSVPIGSVGRVCMPDGTAWDFGYREKKAYQCPVTDGTSIRVETPSELITSKVTGCEGAVSASLFRRFQTIHTGYSIDVSGANQLGALSNVEIIYVIDNSR